MKKLNPHLTLPLLTLLTALPAPNALASAPSSSASTAPTGASVTLDGASCRHFDTAFAQISQQAHVTILAEGQPLHPVLADTQFVALSKALTFGSPVQTKDAAAQVAAAFDYDAEQINPDVILLRKRYSDPMDLPCVTYDETVHALRAILQTTGNYASSDPSSGPNSPEVRFVNSLTSDQLKASKVALSFQSLTPEQAELATTAANHEFMIDQTSLLQAVFDQLSGLKNSGTVFCWTDFNGRKRFSYKGHIGRNGSTLEMAVGNGTMTSIFGDKSPFLSDAGGSAQPGADPTAPTTEDRHLAPGMMVDRLPCEMTLADAVARLPLPSAPSTAGTLSTSGASGKISIYVDPAIAQKPVSVFGQAFSSADHFVRALSALYGLQMVVPKENDYTITLPLQRTTQGIADIPAAVDRLVPLPLARALDGQAIRLLAKSGQVEAIASMTAAGTPAKALAQAKGGKDGDDAAALATAAWHKNFEERQAVQKARDVATMAFYSAAVRRLLVLAVPSVPTPQSPSVPVAQTDPEAMRLIAIALLSEVGQTAFDKLKHTEVPSFLVEPGTMWIQAEKMSHEDLVGFGDGRRNADNRLGLKFASVIPALPKAPTTSQ